MSRTLTPSDGQAVCIHCDTPYRWDRNLLDGQEIWVRDCRPACKREHSKPEARFERQETP